jgi:peptidoglycan/LPS O-acetylase OafA/YrhL
MRLRSIDFLRGIAVFLVFCRHVPFEPILTFSGWVGVDLFFVLSGFLVSNLLFQEYQKLNNELSKGYIL